MQTETTTGSEHRDQPFPWRLTAVLGVLIAAGLIAAAYRFMNGIGSITNLSDGRAWGLWIAFDLYVGVALAAGGFTLAATVYIFRRELYRPVARAAILTAFLGYLMVIVALLVDLGQPWRIWHITIYWNPHSPLFEVGWCVLLYTAVLALEFSPAVFERFNVQAPLRIIRAIEIPLIIAGVVLSTMHQSSLGSVLLLMPDKIHPLWFTPILPLLFLISAIAVGPAMVIVESSAAGRFLGHSVNPAILNGLARGIAYILLIYLVVRLADLLLAGETNLIFSSGVYSVLFAVELTVGVIVPMVMFLLPTVRRKHSALVSGALLVVIGLVLNRFNLTWFALAARPGTTYFPSILEIVVSLAVVSAGVLAYVLAERYLPITQHEGEIVAA